MLKSLIEELSKDSISISVALTRTKVISTRFGISELSKWINCELQGYSDNDDLPDYRKFPCEIISSILDGRGIRHDGYKLDFTHITEKAGFDIYTIEEYQGIQNLEYILHNQNGAYVFAPFPEILVRHYGKFLPRTFHLISVSRRSSISCISNIINQVKQRLLDLLLSIESKYPDAFEGKSEIKTETKDVINNLITYNLYGNHNIAPIAMGFKVNQKTSNSQTQNNIDYLLEELSKHGIENNSLTELKKIVETKDSDNKTVKQKVMAWFGNLITKAAEKGIELEVPTILEKLTNFINGS